MRQYISSEFSHLRHLVPEDKPPYPVCKSTVVPMKILFKDEKNKSETVNILTHLTLHDALSFKGNINSAKIHMVQSYAEKLNLLQKRIWYG